MREPLDALFLSFQSTLAGRYALERELGRGGMGIVYLARDLRLERVVAIKLLPPDRAGDTALRDRFLREARTAARLSHPNIIPIHAVEEIDDFVFFVMAYVHGETLGARIRREGALKPLDAARILREVAWALAYAHSQGIVHRDVKPDNILLEAPAGRALVADFGIARSVRAAGVSGAGEMLGTPEYMSPEQASGDAVDGRSDLYGLGVVAYFALAGRLPFTASSVPALLLQHVAQPPPPLAAPGAPRHLVQAVERCLAKAPAERFQSGEEFAEALGRSLETRRDLPIPVRVFLTEDSAQLRGQLMAPWLAAAFLVPAGLGLLVDAVFSGTVPAMFRYGILAIGLGFGATALIAPLVWELRRLRRLLGAGYKREDLVHGLTGELERRREEQEFLSGPGGGSTRWERLMTRKAYGSLGLASLCGVAAFIVPYPAVLGVFGLFGLSCAVAVVSGMAAVAAGRRRLGVAEEGRIKFWRGRIGRWLFKLAGLGMQRTVPPPLPAGDRPTEMALGLAALDLFEALPRETRAALPDLPAVVRGLEDEARRLRKAAEDSGPAREAAQRRRGAALAALETIRLDLLRLHGGVGRVDSLTANLSAAREVGEQVDRLLQGKTEVERALDGGGRGGTGKSGGGR
ncbi:MAG: protein kinase domain-containing protein [Gemmatimonadales bacterium]